MTEVDELFKTLKDNINNRLYTIPNEPKKCVLHRYFDLINVTGYVVELIGVDYVDRDLLFIADKPHIDLFHHGLAVLESRVFENRCLWIDDDDITIIDTKGFYI